MIANKMWDCVFEYCCCCCQCWPVLTSKHAPCNVQAAEPEKEVREEEGEAAGASPRRQVVRTYRGCMSHPCLCRCNCILCCQVLPTKDRLISDS